MINRTPSFFSPSSPHFASIGIDYSESKSGKADIKFSFVDDSFEKHVEYQGNKTESPTAEKLISLGKQSPLDLYCRNKRTLQREFKQIVDDSVMPSAYKANAKETINTEKPVPSSTRLGNGNFTTSFHYF
jgi:hypothetical protein